jgi:hypothetical protein
MIANRWGPSALRPPAADFKLPVGTVASACDIFFGRSRQTRIERRICMVYHFSIY